MVKESYARRLTPLVLAQFFGVFNDNAFKMFVVLIVFNGMPGYFESAEIGRASCRERVLW